MYGLESADGNTLENIVSVGGTMIAEVPVTRNVKQQTTVIVEINGVPTEVPATIEVPVTAPEPTKMGYDFIAAMTPEARTALRIVEIVADPRPDEGLYIISENPPAKIGGQWRITWGQTPRDPVPLRATAKHMINQAAENARLQWITPGDGQAMSYREKLEEAKDCLANHDAQNPPPAGKYSLLESEVPVKGATTLAVAQLIFDTYTGWKTVEALINNIRVTSLAAVDTADAAGIRQILTGLAWPVPQ